MQPLGCGLFLAYVAFAAFLGWLFVRAWIDVGELGRILLAVMAGSGLACGWLLKSICIYETFDDTRFIGFPVPVMIFKKEGDRWLDYISPVSPFLFILNLLVLTFGCALPVSLAVLVRRWISNRQASG
jgi:hypothetical protein